MGHKTKDLDKKPSLAQPHIFVVSFSSIKTGIPQTYEPKKAQAKQTKNRRIVHKD